jgi:hypothetical protein
LALAVAVLLAGCATTAKQTPEIVVSERAQARWDALLDDRVEDAYVYLSPGYRTGLPLSAYYRRLASRRITYTSAKVTGSECSDNACKVKILIGYAVIGVLPGVQRLDNESTVTEDWILAGDGWYYLPEK